MPENWVTRWVYSPIRVPGSRQVSTRPRRSSARPAGGRGAACRPGRRAARPAPARRPARRSPRRPGTSSATRCRAAAPPADRRPAIEPSWPRMPVSWVTSGTVRPGNHSADHPQHADEGHRVAGADQHAGGDRGRHVGRQREHQLAGGHRERAGQDHPPGAEPVQGDADRHLQGGVDGQLQHEEQRDRGRAGGEPLLRVDRRDPQRGAVEDRDRVGRERHAPHDVGARRRAGGSSVTGRSPRARWEGSPQDDVGTPAHLPRGPGEFGHRDHSAHYSRGRCATSWIPPTTRPWTTATAAAGSCGRSPSCMAEKGYQATTIADIARVARVSKTVVYAHFRDKEHCLLELYSRANDKVLATASGRRRTRPARPGCPGGSGCGPGIGAYLETLAAGPAVAWAALVEVQAAGRPALALRRGDDRPLRRPALRGRRRAGRGASRTRCGR